MLDYFGIADLSDQKVQMFVAEQNKFAAGFPCAISVGAVISSTLADLLPEGDESERGLYKYHLYPVTAARTRDAHLRALSPGMPAWTLIYEVISKLF